MCILAEILEVELWLAPTVDHVVQPLHLLSILLPVLIDIELFIDGAERLHSPDALLDAFPFDCAFILLDHGEYGVDFLLIAEPLKEAISCLEEFRLIPLFVLFDSSERCPNLILNLVQT